MEGRSAVVLLAHTETELATAVLTDPLFDQLNGKRSSSIFQHHYNYLAKVSDIAVLQNTDENTGSLSFPRENTFESFIPPKNKHQRSLCMTYYIMDIQAQCMASIISHLEAVAVMKWWFTMPVFSITYQCGGGVGWRLVRLKSEEGEGSNCWCRSH